MDKEFFTIVIKKNGEIVLQIEGASEQQLRHYRQVLQELLGPIRKELLARADELPPSAIKLSDSQEGTEEQKLRFRWGEPE